MPKFLKRVAESPAELSIRDMITDRLGGSSPARSNYPLHASELTRPNPVFCPREAALHEHVEVKRPSEWVPPILRMTFDAGIDIQRRVNEDYLRDVMVGHWMCLGCRYVYTFSKQPKGDCPQCHTRPGWRYVEVKFTQTDWGVVGSIDALVDVGKAKLHMVEVKIMGQDQWSGLAAPLAEHRLRTALYLRLIAESEETGWAAQIDTQNATILYWLRGYGKKVGSEITPIKEYRIKRDDGLTEPYVAKAKSLAYFRTNGVMPVGVCGSVDDPRAKGCKVRDACFSGSYPAGVKVAYESADKDV